MASAKSKSSSGRSKSVVRYAVCIDNSDYLASLDVGKLYRLLPADVGAPRGWVRIVDESGEDYLFPAKRFVPVELPPKARRVLAAVGAFPVSASSCRTGS